jgi:hypothetical protein
MQQAHIKSDMKDMIGPRLTFRHGLLNLLEEFSVQSCMGSEDKQGLSTTALTDKTVNRHDTSATFTTLTSQGAACVCHCTHQSSTAEKNRSSVLFLFFW